MIQRKVMLPASLIMLAVLAVSVPAIADAFAGQTSTPDPASEAPSERGESGIAPAADFVVRVNEAFVSLAERTMPSVVRIEVRRDRSAGAPPTPRFQLPDPFRRFFEIPDLGRPDAGPRPRNGGGTGFVVTESGYIVTNDHVVADADEITVWLHDRTSHEGTLVGSDPTTDLAVVRIEGRDLSPLQWGSSDALRVGEWVVAVGNPGVGGGRLLDYTVTSGIVSAKNRPLELIGRSPRSTPGAGEELAGYAIENFIQTDAVINPGNSGGPLLNLRGEVVGINTAIASTSGYYQGYGFAVPADLARRVVDDLIEDGSVQRAWLGVLVSEVSQEDAELYELPRVSGVLVQSATAGGPAEAAGLRPEDVILALDGQPIQRAGGLQQRVAERRPGDEVEVTIMRDGRERRIRVTLGQLPLEEEEGRRPSTMASSTAALDRLGIEVENVTPRIARELAIDDTTGVAVRAVEPLGPAARRGVVPGLRLLEVNDRSITRTADVDEALGDVESGEVVRLLLQSPDGRTRVANVRVR